MFCGKCGSKINDGEKFCGRCGNAVQQEQMQYLNATPTPLVESAVKNNNIKDKKSLVILLCSIALALSVVLGVIFISDWDNDVPAEQVGYVSEDNETDFSEHGEEYISDENLTNSDKESTTLDNKVNDIQTEENTTKKNYIKETTTTVVIESETTTCVAITETTTNKIEGPNTTTIDGDFSSVHLSDRYPQVTATLGPIDWPDLETISIPS